MRVYKIQWKERFFFVTLRKCWRSVENSLKYLSFHPKGQRVSQFLLNQLSADIFMWDTNKIYNYQSPKHRIRNFTYSRWNKFKILEYYTVQLLSFWPGTGNSDSQKMSITSVLFSLVFSVYYWPWEGKTSVNTCNNCGLMSLIFDVNCDWMSII